MHFTDHHEIEYCRCPANYTGVDCSVLTSCGDNCESHEMCMQEDPYPDCKGMYINSQTFKYKYNISIRGGGHCRNFNITSVIDDVLCIDMDISMWFNVMRIQ